MTQLSIGPTTAGATIVPVLLDGKKVAELSRAPAGLWRNATLVVDGLDVAQGLPEVVAYLTETFGVVPDVQIELHTGYLALYGPTGIPHARVLSTDGRHQLRIFEPHYGGLFDSREAAIAAVGPLGG